MNYYYSAKESGFYFEGDIEIYKAGKGWPDDAIPVTDKYYKSLLSGQRDGMAITADSNGYPILTAQPAPEGEELQQQARNKKESLMQQATKSIALLERAVRLGISTNEEKVNLTNWEVYSVLLNRIKPEDAPNIKWPEVPEDVA